jgi:hypothetical protein
MGKGNRSGLVTLTCIFLVELPGIELGANSEILPSDLRRCSPWCEPNDAKHREITCGNNEAC